MIKNLLKYYFQKIKISQMIVAKPTLAEIQKAINKLNEMSIIAVFGQPSNEKPSKNNRLKSWWGGNFLGSIGESVPVCKSSGRLMHPILQIKVDELSYVPDVFKEFDLISLWMDIEADVISGSTNGSVFTVRTYDKTDNLVPLGHGYRQSHVLPTFPVIWSNALLDQPDWDDFSDEILESVAISDCHDWFFQNKIREQQTNSLSENHFIKLSGWPNWIQGSDWPNEDDFFLQIDTNVKGKFAPCGGGSIYLFKSACDWQIRHDFF